MFGWFTSTARNDMKTVKIQWLKTGGSGISQIYASGIQFCFVSDDLRQCHPLVYCKDFLQDAVHGYLHKQRASIYGFTYDPSSRPPLAMGRTRIALANKKDKAFADHIPAMVEFLNHFAKAMKLKPTRARAVSNPPPSYKSGVFLTDGSPRWMNSPPLLSMYSLLMRVGLAHTPGTDPMATLEGVASGKVKPYQTNDRSQAKSAINGIKNILKVGYRKFFYIDNEKNYPKNAVIDTMHNSCGIVGFSSGTSRRVVPYWHRKSLTNELEAKK